MGKKSDTDAERVQLTQTWQLPVTATLGSGVRAKGIFQEIRARVPVIVRKAISLEAGTISLSLPVGSRDRFDSTVASIDRVLEKVTDLAVIPREVEDILAISTTERHKWLKDGRLPSAGTRTVKLRGRARKITFHVFDPEVIEDILDRGATEIWREHDRETASENRKRAAAKAKLIRSQKNLEKQQTAPKNANSDGSTPKGWDEFNADGLLK
ncbi:hypothetical protein [Brucella sp. NBRC 12950]|uniref:hypothetical protein n=1 Tax=Brucella sp. NBRC 12950 TaxID=2994518 RepID=UPI0024A22359|nr:hypothetical protein [Brucella sp. NBRC 12950]GLU29276.1 hypothetical protein Brsp01_45090 [Brucella sp. NBRC 12950]